MGTVSSSVSESFAQNAMDCPSLDGFVLSDSGALARALQKATQQQVSRSLRSKKRTIRNGALRNVITPSPSATSEAANDENPLSGPVTPFLDSKGVSRKRSHKLIIDRGAEYSQEPTPQQYRSPATPSHEELMQQLEKFYSYPNCAKVEEPNSAHSTEEEAHEDHEPGANPAVVAENSEAEKTSTLFFPSISETLTPHNKRSFTKSSPSSLQRSLSQKLSELESFSDLHAAKAHPQTILSFLHQNGAPSS